MRTGYSEWSAAWMTNEPPRVVLVRHGETAWSRDRRHTGRTDIPLTALGEVQAAALAPRLAAWHFTQVLVSPLSRARLTAELAGLEDPQTCEDLVEWDYGEYEGKRSVDIRKIRPGWNAFQDGCPGGEMPSDVAARADRLIARLAAACGRIATGGCGRS